MSVNRELAGNRKDENSSISIQPKQQQEIIKIRSFDYSDLIEKFKFSLVGRKFHNDGRSTKGLMAFMKRSRIWDVEGRVTRYRSG